MTKVKCSALTKAGSACRRWATNDGVCDLHATAPPKVTKPPKPARAEPVEKVVDPDAILRGAFVTLLFAEDGEVYLGQLSFSKAKLEELPYDEKTFVRREIRGGGPAPEAPKSKPISVSAPPAAKPPSTPSKCTYKFTRGRQRGELCGKEAVIDSELCSAHTGSKSLKTKPKDKRPVVVAKKTTEEVAPRSKKSRVRFEDEIRSVPVVEKDQPSAPIEEKELESKVAEPEELVCPDFYTVTDKIPHAARFHLKHLDRAATTIAHNKNYLRLVFEDGEEIAKSHYNTHGTVGASKDLLYYIGLRGNFHIVKANDTDFSLNEVLAGMEVLVQMRGLEQARMSSILYNGKCARARCNKKAAPTA